MSIQSAQIFIERLATDKAFQKSVVDAVGGKTGSAATDAAVAFGNESGFTFTPNELVQARDAANPTELDEESLDTVTGGGDTLMRSVSEDKSETETRPSSALEIASNMSAEAHATMMAIIGNMR